VIITLLRRSVKKMLPLSFDDSLDSMLDDVGVYVRIIQCTRAL